MREIITIRSEVPRLFDQISKANVVFDGLTLRPPQIELAKRDIRHGVSRWVTSPGHTASAPLMIQEAGVGIGKTLEELLVAALFAQEGRRTVIAINTISLRQQIGREKKRMQRLLRAGYAELGLRPPRAVTVEELVSLSQFFSVSKIETINDAVRHGDLTDEDRAEWKKFYDFIRSRPGSRIDIHEWYEHGDGQPLPLGLSPLNLCLDETGDKDLVADILAERERAFQADILIVTHTMLRLLTWRLRYLDWREHNNKPITNDCGGYEFLKIDEAHSLPKITRSWIEQSIRFDAVRSLLEQSPLPADHIINLIEELQSYLTGRLAGRKSLFADNPDEYHPIAERVVDIFLPMCELLRALGDQYPIFEGKLETVLSALAPMVVLKRRGNAAGAQDASFNDYSTTDCYPIVFQRGREYGMTLTLKPGMLGRSTISSLWRRNPDLPSKRLYKSVSMLSGTLTDAEPSPTDPYRYFRYEIGAVDTSGPDQEVMWYGNPIPPANVGHALEIIYPERSLQLLPTIGEGEPNVAHTFYIARMLCYIYDHPTRGKRANRVLALFMSERALLAAVEAVKALRPDVAKHVIAQRSGVRFMGNPRNEFRKDDRAILFSMNWEGINAVAEDETTSLVDHLVITKAPFMPVDERRQRELAHATLETRIMFNEAIWRFRQALGRAMRDPSARFTLWIGDPRIPLPNEMSPPLPKYTKQPNPFMTRLYDLFDRHCSLQLFGQSGCGRTGLLASPVTLGYLERTGDDGLVLKELEVMLAPRPGDD